MKLTEEEYSAIIDERPVGYYLPEDMAQRVRETLADCHLPELSSLKDCKYIRVDTYKLALNGFHAKGLYAVGGASAAASGRIGRFISKTKLFSKPSRGQGNGDTSDSAKRQRVLAAARAAIQSQIDEFRSSRDKSKPIICGITGNEVNWLNAHVDHIVPFITIFNNWITSLPHVSKTDIEPLTEEEITKRIVAIELNRQGHIKDLRLRRKWQEYHRKHARLQFAEASANHAKGAR